MYKYKLVKKINPQDKAAPKKWYAIPISEVPQTVKAMTRAATENTTTAPIEMEAALELLGRHARQQLQQGHTVRVGDLGTIRVSFKSDGVEDITDFNAGAMIKNPRIIFTPSKANNVFSFPLLIATNNNSTVYPLLRKRRNSSPTNFFSNNPTKM